MILLIDTSTDPYKLALFWPKKIQKEFSATRQDRKDALFYIDQFLRKNRVKLSDLKAVAVYRGPGSFTGLRVGISIANALGYALKIPVVGFSGSKYQNNPLLMAKEAYKKLKTKKIKPGDIAKPIYSK